MGNVTSLCSTCAGTTPGDVDRNMIDAKLEKLNLQSARWKSGDEESLRSNPNLTLPQGPSIMSPDSRAKGIIKNSPRGLPALLVDHNKAKKIMDRDEDDMDTEAYQALLDNMTVDDTTHHCGPLTEDDDAYGMRTEDDLTIMGDATERDVTESMALKSSRSNKNVSWRENIRVDHVPARSAGAHRSALGTKDSYSPSVRNTSSLLDGTDTRWADSEAQNSQLLSQGNRSDDVRKRLAAQSRKYLRNAEIKKSLRSGGVAGV
mmetsp:Transcript_16850/g.24766  ORF Transcript_16850/g.24766 Transcript_16850/m.24766 type:complete len:261 (+) Transcript_16850:18-800(+)